MNEEKANPKADKSIIIFFFFFFFIPSLSPQLPINRLSSLLFQSLRSLGEDRLLPLTLIYVGTSGKREIQEKERKGKEKKEERSSLRKLDNISLSNSALLFL